MEFIKVDLEVDIPYSLLNKIVYCTVPEFKKFQKSPIVTEFILENSKSLNSNKIALLLWLLLLDKVDQIMYEGVLHTVI